MNTKYKDLIEQTFDFPQEEFKTTNGDLFFHNIVPFQELLML